LNGEKDFGEAGNKCQYLNQLRKLEFKAIFGLLNLVRAFSEDFDFILFSKLFTSLSLTVLPIIK